MIERTYSALISDHSDVVMRITSSPYRLGGRDVPLSDAHWREIVAAAARRVPKASARAGLEVALADYRGVVRDPNKLKAARARLRRVVKLARKLEVMLRPRPAPVVVTARWRAEKWLDGLDRLVQARARRSDPELGFLLGRLFDVWVDFFGGKLTVTDPPAGGKPTGPLVRFIQAATRGMFRRPISPHTIRAVARRERAGHERLRRLLIRKTLSAISAGEGILDSKK